MARISEIRFVGYGIPDLAAERAFYRDKWGLVEVAERDGLIYFAAEGHDERYVVRLRHAESKGIDVIALAARTRADVDTLFEKVQRAACKIIFAPKNLPGLGGGYGFRFFSADGLPFEISSDVERGVARALQPGAPVPQRISHIVLHSPNHKATVQFFVDVLGFRLSDWLGDFMAFLRCNEWHHRIAVLPGPPCLNHVAYDMVDIDAMMRGIAKLKKQDVEIVWGPGRHTAGDNTFSYFTTPNGFAVEYTSGLERVPEERQPNVYTPTPELMDRWGVGIGGPHTMPRPQPDARLFQAADV